jgi:hypothetical protein
MKKKAYSYVNAAKIKKDGGFISRHRYAACCLMSSFASLLGFVNPVLSSFIVKSIIDNSNLRGIVPTFVSMAAVKGTRMYLRSKVASQLKGSMRAPLVWLQHRISKRLWWLEPMVNNWGWVGLVITKLTGGVPAQTAAFIVSMLTDTVNALLSGIVYYFTQSYVLSLLTVLIIPSLAVVPWFASKTMRPRPAKAHPR